MIIFLIFHSFLGANRYESTQKLREKCISERHRKYRLVDWNIVCIFDMEVTVPSLTTLIARIFDSHCMNHHQWLWQERGEKEYKKVRKTMEREKIERQ